MLSLHATTSIRADSLVLPTCERPQAVSRAVRSFLEDRRTHGRRHRIVVADDSPSPATRSLVRATLASLGREYAAPVLYAGFEEKLRFGKGLLASADVPPFIVKFALFDAERCGLGTYGANRNALLLETAGETAIMADDDTVCQVASGPASVSGVAVVSEDEDAAGHPCETWTYADQGAALRETRFETRDFVALHEAWLGRSVQLRPESAALPATSAGHSVEHAEGPLADRLRVRPGHVAMTLPGTVGDCGWSSPTPYLFLDGASFSRLTASEERYRAACRSRQVRRAAPRSSLTDGNPSVPGVSAGLDNRTPLPPFLPVGRGEDTVFFRTLIRCRPDACIAHLPWMLLHAPLEERAFSGGEVNRSASGVALDQYLSVLIDTVTRDHAEPGLTSVGLALQDLAQRPPAEFHEFASSQVRRAVERRLDGLEARLRQRGGLPHFWARDTRKYLDTARGSLVTPDSFLPLDLVYGRTRDEARALAQRLALRFGQLLASWPALAEAARNLKAAGEPLARPA